MPADGAIHFAQTLDDEYDGVNPNEAKWFGSPGCRVLSRSVSWVTSWFAAPRSVAPEKSSFAGRKAGLSTRSKTPWVAANDRAATMMR